MKNTLSATPALTRGLAILEYLASQGRPCGFNDLMENLALPRATCARLLSVLRKEGYITQTEKGRKYILGTRINGLIRQNRIPDSLTRGAGPLLASLVEATGNTAALFFYHGGQTEVLAKELHMDSVVMQFVGQRSPLSACPWSLIFLLALPPEEREREEIPLLRDTRFQALQAANATHYPTHGYVIDDGTGILGVRRLAAPIRSDSGSILAALGLAGTSFSLPRERVEPCARELIRHAMKFSTLIIR